MKVPVRVKAKYTLEVIRPEGKDEYEFNNLVTYGLAKAMDENNGDFNSMFFYCGVGTGSAPPAVTDTTFSGTKIADTSNGSNKTYVSGIDPNDNTRFLFTHTVRHEFSLGAVVGNVAEVAHSNITNRNRIINRALTLDSNGVPTAIPVTNQDQLVVNYEITVSIPLSTTFTVDIGGVSTQVDLYLAATSTSVNNITNLSQLPSVYLNGPDATPNTRLSYGTVTPIPYPTTPNVSTGTTFQMTRLTPDVVGDGVVSGKARYSIGQANDPAGIGQISFSGASLINDSNSAWVMNFNPPVNKVDGELFEIEVSSTIVNL